MLISQRKAYFYWPKWYSFGRIGTGKQHNRYRVHTYVYQISMLCTKTQPANAGYSKEYKVNHEMVNRGSNHGNQVWPVA